MRETGTLDPTLELSCMIRSRLEAHRSLHDVLTGLLNRRAFDERLPIESARSRRYGHSLALCFLDLDGFKSINDRHGHLVGDEVLHAVAEAIRQSRLSDDVFRIGGDEFAILLPGCSREEAGRAMGRLLESIDLGPLGSAVAPSGYFCTACGGPKPNCGR